MISIIVPTINEALNIPELFRRIHATMKTFSYEIIVVDDNSPDGTGNIVLKQTSDYNYPVKLVTRPSKQGLALAVIAGFKESSGDIICVMDADLQHPIETITEMMSYIISNDIVIASRYTKTGSIKRWSLERQITSDGAKTLARILLPRIKNITDPMSGFFMFNKKVIKNVKLNPIGYKILLEILVRGNYNTVHEVPFEFQERKHGKSNLNITEYISYARHLFRLVKDTELNTMIKFGVVGISGIIVNEGVLYYLFEKANVNLYISILFAIQISLITNFILNSLWTFKTNYDKMHRSLIIKFIRFETICVVGAAINFSLFIILTKEFEIYYLVSNLIAIMTGFLFNYFGSRRNIWIK